MQFHRKSVLGLAVALVLLPAAFAQTITTGDVVGTVKDTTGAVVPGAMVTLKNIESGDTRSVSTEATGAFRFTFLKPGDYTVSATAAGLKSDVQKIAVLVGQVNSLDLVAKVQTTQEVIEVAASGALVETENANLSTTYNAKQMDELPTPGGDMTTIAYTAPGVVMSTGMGYGNFSAHGLPGVSNLFTINGNDYNDAFLNLNNSGASNLLLGQNEVQEAAVVQNAYSVQYGREAGAQVNYITKSGTNGFHGDATWNWNGDILNANDFFLNSEGVQRPRAISNEWAGDFGGPIKKNKLFFYVDTEGLYYTLPAAGVVEIPTPQLQTYIAGNVSAGSLPLYQQAFKVWNNAPGVGNAVPMTNGPGPLQDGTGNLGCGVFGFTGTPAPGGGTFGTTVPCAEGWATASSNTNKEHLYTIRGDYSLTDKQKIYARIKHDDGFQPTGTNLLNSQLNEQSIQPEWDGAINYTYVISPTIVNSFIGSALWYSAYFGPASVSASQSVFPSYFGVGGESGGNSGFYSMGVYWPAFPQGRDVGQGQIIDDLSITRGSHTIKVGGNFRRNRVSDFGLLEGVTPSYFFGSLNDFANGVTNLTNNYASYLYQSFTNITTAHSRLYNLGVYAQDEWNAAKNLKLTFGVRFDRTGNPVCTDACFSRLTAPFTSSSFQTGIDIPYNQSIDTGLSNAYYSVDSIVPQPRLGFVWNPKGTPNSLVIRGGFGLFADLAPAFLISNLYSNAPYPFHATVYGGQTVGLASDPASAAATAVNEFNAFKTGFFNGATLGDLENAVPGFGPFGYYSVDQHFSTPTYAEWSFELEQPFAEKNVFVVTYSGNHGYNLLVQNGWVNAANLSGNTFVGLPTSVPDPRFLGITQLQNNGISNYNGVTFQYRRAFSHGFQGQINYTWSHSLDDISNGGSGLPFSGSSLTSMINPNISQNYGNSDYDIRHNVTSDFVWDMPFKFGNRALDYVLGNWTLSNKLYLRSGVPETIIDGNLPAIGENTINATMTATAVTAVPEHCGNASVNGAVPCLTSSMFLPSLTETTFGNIGRNTLFGPGYFNFDTSLYKNIPIRERFRFTIGVSAYNLFNHAHFADPDGNIASGGLGGIYGTVEEPTSAYGAFQGSVVSGRVMVLTAKVKF